MEVHTNPLTYLVKRISELSLVYIHDGFDD
jgi:hypothetical protein